MPEKCYPCSISGHACVLEDSWEPQPPRRRRVLVPLLPYASGEYVCPWFDVALWLRAEQKSFPDYVSYVEAVSAFAAVEQMMQHYRLRRVAIASVRALDGFLVYRAYGVQVSLEWRPVSEASSTERCRK